LTARAIIAAAAGLHDTLNTWMTLLAGMPFAAIDQELMLELALAPLAIDVI
jgi:hypothetical protein